MYGNVRTELKEESQLSAADEVEEESKKDDKKTGPATNSGPKGTKMCHKCKKTMPSTKFSKKQAKNPTGWCKVCS